MGEAHFLLGKAYEGMNEKEKSTQAFKKAKGQMEENYEILLKVGADYLEKEAYEDALRELEKASKFAEAASTVYFLLGKTYRGLGRNEDAIKAFEKADEMMEKD